MRKIIRKSALIISAIAIFNIWANTPDDEFDFDKDLQAIEKEIKKIEQKVRKQEKEEEDIDVLKEMNKAEKLMREVYKNFTELSTGKKGNEIIAILKKAEEKLSDIVSKVKLNIHPTAKKQQEIIDVLEKIIKNTAFRISSRSSQNQKKQDQQFQMSEQELQKLLKQLKKQRAKEQKKKQRSKPTANQPALSAYEVPPSEPPTAETKSPTDGNKAQGWGNMPERERESVEETEPDEIPQDVGVLYKEFQKALGKEETK